jgi:putative sigma-54 modulation protein
MNIEFTSRRARLHDGVKELFEKKLGKLEKVLPQDVQVHVILRGENKGVSLEVTVVGRQRTWTATEAGVEQETLAHAVLERIEAQIRKSKAKVKEKKKHRPSALKAGKDAAEEPAEEPKNRPATALRPEVVMARPTFEEDALHKFVKWNRDVMVYRDPSDESFRVLYRRRDGTIGLLTPT